MPSPLPSSSFGYYFATFRETKTIYNILLCVGQNIEKKSSTHCATQNTSALETPWTFCLLFALQIMDNDFCRQLTNKRNKNGRRKWVDMKRKKYKHTEKRMEWKWNSVANMAKLANREMVVFWTFWWWINWMDAVANNVHSAKAIFEVSFENRLMDAGLMHFTRDHYFIWAWAAFRSHSLPLSLVSLQCSLCARTSFIHIIAMRTTIVQGYSISVFLSMRFLFGAKMLFFIFDFNHHTKSTRCLAAEALLPLNEWVVYVC